MVTLHGPLLNIQEAASLCSVKMRCSAYSGGSFDCGVLGPLPGSKISGLVTSSSWDAWCEERFLVSRKKGLR